MCGIIGCINTENAPLVARDSLKRMEYRGYDSWGVFNGTDTQKFKGPPSGDYDFTWKSGNGLAIGHTRWATHGAVNIIRLVWVKLWIEVNKNTE